MPVYVSVENFYHLFYILYSIPGVDYRGVLACLDGYMNIALEQTEVTTISFSLKLCPPRGKAAPPPSPTDIGSKLFISFGAN
jgi:hypothetical protein